MTHSQTRAEIVSSEDEALILVDSNDRPRGQLAKAACHDGDGRLHRAFSLFIFDPTGRLLIQQRADGKRLWPGFWSNSCCSHPRAGENMGLAVSRRLKEELGLRADLDFVYKFEYTAHYQDLGTEHELCWVYVGRTDQQPVVNTTEIMGWRWIEPDQLTAELETLGERYTPWFKMEWQRLNDEFATAITPAPAK